MPARKPKAKPRKPAKVTKRKPVRKPAVKTMKRKDLYKKKAGEFGEEVEQAAERFGERMEEFGEEMEERGRKVEKWHIRKFGAAGPLISAIIVIACIVLGTWVLDFFAWMFTDTLLKTVSVFLFSNLMLFFAVMLVTGYLDYITNRLVHTWKYLTPVSKAIGLTFLSWLIGKGLLFLGTRVSSQSMIWFSTWTLDNLAILFIVFLALGYVFVALTHYFEGEVKVNG